jgi:Uma2 family endonuclease
MTMYNAMRFRRAMSREIRVVTADELMRMPDDGYSYELVQGRLIRMPKPGALHGIIGTRLFSALIRVVEEHDLGAVFPQDTGFKLTANPDTVRAPDLAFVTRDRVASVGFPEGFWPGAPDLAVEVRSPHDSLRELAAKAGDYLSHGSRLVWLIDPRRQEVTVFRPGHEPVTLVRADTLSGSDVVPDFQLPVVRLFE